jgi:N-acetylglucosamine transport system permease protein
MHRGRYPFILGFLAAPVTLYAVFVISPAVQAFQISLTNWRGVSARADYIGLANYRQLLRDHAFWDALRNHGILLLALPLLTISIGLVFAFLLNAGGRTGGGNTRGIRGSRFYRVVFFFPQMLAVAVIAVLFQAVYRPDSTGVLNGALDSIGVDPMPFLTSPRLALWSIVGVLVWQSVGFYVVLFSAGMASIPGELYEAAELDGASRTTVFFRLTLPLLWDTIQVAWVYLGIAAFDGFAIVWVLSVDKGGPDGATTVLAVEIYRNAFEYSKFGYASAMGVSLLLLTMTFAVFALRTSRREAIEF